MPSTVETVLPLMYPSGESVVGRMGVFEGGDPSDFDFLPVEEAFMTEEQAEAMVAGDEEQPKPFVTPRKEPFPVFKASLRKFMRSKQNPRVARIDTDETYGEFVCESAIRELTRKLEDLQARLEAHEEDPHAHQRALATDVVGAVKALSTLRSAKTVEEAADAMPSVPVNVPPFAEGKVKCWKDGDSVVCSMRFQAIDGKARTATMAAKPKMDGAEVAGCLAKSDIDPITLLGIIPDLADAACAKNLVKEVAGAALKAQRRADIFGQDEPLLVASTSNDEISVPMAAFMDLEQRADMGDLQASRELNSLRAAARTSSGRKIAAPVMNEAHRRLNAARQKRNRSWLAESYMQAAGWI